MPAVAARLRADRRRPRLPAAPAPAARDRILAAALAEFADCGFDGASTTEIARRAGVTQPLVHYHFASKDALWRAAIRHCLAQLAASFDGTAAALAEADPVTRVRELIRRFVRFSAAHPELGKFMAREGARGGPRMRWLAEQIRPMHEAALAALRAGGIAGRAIPPEHLIFVVIPAAAYLFGVPAMARALYGLDVGDPAVVEAHADGMLEILTHGLLRREKGRSA